jgi:hypothetical protein
LNPETFKLVRSIAGSCVASADGLFLHALVFVIVCHFVWQAGYELKPSDI